MMLRVGIALGLCFVAGCSTAPVPRGESVIVLHGLGRTPVSMLRMASHLEAEGYLVRNVGYPSRSKPIERLVNEHLVPAVAEMPADQPLHFVAHSLGGILVRHLAASTNRPPHLGRLVMLGPPNQGSEMADPNSFFLRTVQGPAFLQLGTQPESVPNALGPVDFEVGVITGDRTFNPWFSRKVEGADDGKVSVERARLEGMTDFRVFPMSHTWYAWRRRVLEETVHFFEHGQFFPVDE